MLLLLYNALCFWYASITSKRCTILILHKAKWKKNTGMFHGFRTTSGRQERDILRGGWRNHWRFPGRFVWACPSLWSRLQSGWPFLFLLWRRLPPLLLLLWSRISPISELGSKIFCQFSRHFYMIYNVHLLYTGRTWRGGVGVGVNIHVT